MQTVQEWNKSDIELIALYLHTNDSNHLRWVESHNGNLHIVLKLKAGLCCSKARWPLAPNFCSRATRKSQIFHTNHMLGTLEFQSTGLPSIFLRAQPWKGFIPLSKREAKIKKSSPIFFSTSLLYFKILPTNLVTCKLAMHLYFFIHHIWGKQYTMRRCFFTVSLHTSDRMRFFTILQDKCLVPSNRRTRNLLKLNIPLFKKASGQRSFNYRTVSVWPFPWPVVS